MGTVFRARDTELGRDVAIKMLRGATGSARLRREARALARLEHPNVVKVFEVGEHAGDPYVVMELVEGRSLEAWLRDGPSLRAILDVFHAAGRGLAAAHAANLVHRDFKPANVLVGNDGRARVADFGLVLPFDSTAVRDTGVEVSSDPAASSGSLTATGKVVGTPAYVSPEQWLGTSADARSDQWSYCVALWEASYGARPFVGRTIESLRDAILSGRPPAAPPGTRVPKWLRAILERGLAPDPADRFANMEALLAAMERGRRQGRRRRLAAPLAFGLTAVAALAFDRGPGDRVCSPTDPAVERIWSSARKHEAEVALVATGVPHARASYGARPFVAALRTRARGSRGCRPPFHQPPVTRSSPSGGCRRDRGPRAASSGRCPHGRACRPPPR